MYMHMYMYMYVPLHVAALRVLPHVVITGL